MKVYKLTRTMPSALFVFNKYSFLNSKRRKEGKQERKKEKKSSQYFLIFFKKLPDNSFIKFFKSHWFIKIFMKVDAYNC